MNDRAEARQAARRALEQGYAHHQAGRLDTACACYHEALEYTPDDTEVLHLLGAAELQRRRFADAAHAIHRGLEAGGETADARYNLGLALAGQQRWAEAIAAFDSAIALRPDFVPAHGRRGNALRALGRLEDALAAYAQALALDSRSVDTLHDAGEVLQDLERHGEAVEMHERALIIAPGDAAGCFFLGNANRAAGRVDAALAAHRRAVSIDAGFTPAWNAIGLIHRDRGDFTAALDAYRRGLEADPRAGELLNNAGIALKSTGALDAARVAFERALALDPHDARVANNLADTLQHQGRIEDAVATYRRALAAEPLAEIHSGLFFCRHYEPAFDAAESLAEARRFDALHAAPVAPAARRFENDRSPERQLRIGYLSADLCRHPVGFFFGPVIEAHDRDRFEVHCYAGVSQPDALTERIHGYADRWTEVGGLSDDAVAERILADRIDVLAELGAHTRGHRLLVLARRAAPLQVIAGGHFDTSGLRAADYLIADAHHAPAGADDEFAETPIRLPDGYVCYRAPDYAPPVAPAPCESNGHVTFGCFSRVQKVTRGIVAEWAAILTAVPDSRLRLQAREWEDPPTRARYAALFDGHGVDADRVDFIGSLPHDRALAEYSSIDLILDCYPYSGGLTTCEALWMGVPVVTLAGPTFAGRHGTSHLHNVGLGELACTTPATYRALAIALANDRERLVELRAGLRPRMAASALCDAARYTRHLESAYREMWRRWLAG